MKNNELLKEQLFENNYDSLTPKQQDIARVIANNPFFASYASVEELAKKADVNPSTIVRFAQALNFKGYPQLRHNIRHFVLHIMPDQERYHQKDDYFEQNVCKFEKMISLDIKNLEQTIEILDQEELDFFAEKIISSGKTIIISSGTYAAVGLVLSSLCQSMGYPVYLINQGGPHISAVLATLKQDDFLIGISYWRGLREIVTAMRWARENNIFTGAITDTVYSTLNEYSDHTITIPTEGAMFFQSLTASISVIYSLTLEIWERTSEKQKEKYYDNIRQLQKDLMISFESFEK